MKDSERICPMCGEVIKVKFQDEATIGGPDAVMTEKDKKNGGQEKFCYFCASLLRIPVDEEKEVSVILSSNVPPQRTL